MWSGCSPELANLSRTARVSGHLHKAQPFHRAAPRWVLALVSSLPELVDFSTLGLDHFSGKLNSSNTFFPGPWAWFWLSASREFEGAASSELGASVSTWI